MALNCSRGVLDYIYCLQQFCLNGNSLERNPLSDVLHRNLGVVINGQGPGRHLPKGASYRDLGTMISEQGSGRHLSDALHLRPV